MEFWVKGGYFFRAFDNQCQLPIYPWKKPLTNLAPIKMREGERENNFLMG